jgi:hypothetical protein
MTLEVNLSAGWFSSPSGGIQKRRSSPVPESLCFCGAYTEGVEREKVNEVVVKRQKPFNAYGVNAPHATTFRQASGTQPKRGKAVRGSSAVSGVGIIAAMPNWR